MEQIYYTQCPMGYGLGASNGFQIKRIGAGYPPSGDVRHLALRAFLPGSNSKAMAPGALRYRRVGPVAEVAWLEPRAREYETERGQWGRPGGHFAHGLRLGAEELAALGNWPAGLFGRPFWRRSDPEPSRGRRPEALAVTPDDLLAPPDFEHVAPRIDLDAETLARLLSAVAEAVRSGRALFLIDEPGRLGPRIAALTFAFPGVLRPELTFSTYHDRPEELSGFRIHGTAPSPLIRRAMLAGLGPIADLTSGRFEPPTSPPEWALGLATWLTRRDPRDAEDWNRTDARAVRSRRPDDPATLWSDAWLDGLIGLADAARSPASTPTTGEQWRRLAGRASWASAVGLADELVESHGPRWWRPIIREASNDRSAHEAFWALTLAPPTPDGDAEAGPAAWGELAAHFWVRYRSPRREQILNAAVRRIAPPDRLARFLDGMIRTLPIESGHEALEWLERRGEVEPRVLLPLRSRVAVGLLRDQGRSDAMRDVLARAIELLDVLPTVLDLIADEAGPADPARPVAAAVAEAMEHADPVACASYEAWALRRRADGGEDWLAPAIRRLFATEINRPDWEALRDRTAPALRPALARICLDVAGEPGGSPEAYLWSVECLLLGIPGPDRPSSPRWVEVYLETIGSPFDLAARLRDRRDGLPEWLDGAKRSGGLSPRATNLLDDAESIGSLIDGRGTLPAEELLARLPTSDRTAVLGLLIDRLAGGQFEATEPIIDRCSRSWPGAFAPGADGLDRLAAPIADLLLQFLLDPELWIAALGRTIGRLGLDRASSHWPHAGIAAAVVTETCRLTADPASAWDLRSALLRDDRAYRCLAGDLAQDLFAEQPRRAVEVAHRWDLHLDKGTHASRFFEVLLNACDGPRLAAVVPEFAADLRTLGPMSCWVSGDHEDMPPDLREAVATRIPMAPLATPRSVAAVEAWLLPGASRPLHSTIREEPDVLPVPDDEPDGPTLAGGGHGDRLSDGARARWECIRALTEFHWQGKTDEIRWSELFRWKKGGVEGGGPPIPSLVLDDRYDFLAWLILGLEHPGADSYNLETLARWLVKGLGLSSRARVAGCLDAITARGFDIPEDCLRLARDLAHQVALQVDD